MNPERRTFTWTSALIVGIFQIGGSFGAAHNQPERLDMDLLGILLLAAGALSLGVRHQWPRATLLTTIVTTSLYIGAGYAYGPVFIAIVIAMFNAVQLAERRSTWSLAAFAYITLVVAMEIGDKDSDGPPLLVRLALVAGWVVAIIAVSEVVRARREQARIRRDSVEEVARRRASEHQLRIAQDLHDVLAHNISLINVQASVALHLLDTQPEQARPALSNIKAASHEALTELRGALHSLRNDESDPYRPTPTISDLESLIDGVRASGLQIVFDAPTPPFTVPQNIQVAIYRVMQEALTNITRHANALTATVRIAYGEQIELEIIDDGTGGAGEVADEPGNGIVGMRERISAVSGMLNVGPRPEGGYRVHAVIPKGPE